LEASKPKAPKDSTTKGTKSTPTSGKKKKKIELTVPHHVWSVFFFFFKKKNNE